MRTKHPILFPVIFVAGVAASQSAFAGCAPGAKEVFFCEASKGRVIQVCDAGKTIEYTFGNPRKPDLVLAAARDTVTTSQWNGMGPMSYDVSVPNGNTVYTVFWSFDRNPDHNPEAGVSVEIDKKPAATVQCVPGKPIRNRLEDIDLPHAR